MRVSRDQGPDREDLFAFKRRQINARHNMSEDLISSASVPAKSNEFSWSTHWQLRDQHNPLNLKRFGPCSIGEISPMVGYWTSDVRPIRCLNGLKLSRKRRLT